MSDAVSPEATTEPEATPPGPEVQASPDALEIARLTADLDAARKRIDELARAYQAGERDREAFKQRVTREREQMLDVERGTVALTVLEAVDELDLCVANADESALAKGVRLIRDSLLKKVQAMGVERVELEGRPYDPNQAEASDMEVTTDPAADGAVIGVMRACYTLKGRVIRPGRVKVAKFVQPAQA